MFCPTARALAADPDPDEFAPVGYEFCGWREFTEGGWNMEWDESLAGAYLVAFARKMTCKSARRNVLRVRYMQKPPYRPTRPGYRRKTLESDYEHSDVRCVKRKPSIALPLANRRLTPSRRASHDARSRSEATTRCTAASRGGCRGKVCGSGGVSAVA